MSFYAAYALCVTLVGIILLAWLFLTIRRAERRRAERLERLKRFDAIRTESPVENQIEEARDRGLASVATRFTFLRRVLIPIVIVFVIVSLAIPLLEDVPATYVSLMVAVVGVVVGIAAKPLLENMFAGVVISFSQPVRIGDTVLVDGHYGTIEDISITHVTIKIWDWRRYMVPNHRMIEKDFINFTITDRYQWAHVEFWVAPDVDMQQVREIAINSAKSSMAHAPYEDPRLWVMEMGKEGIRCWVAAWADSPSAAWQLMHDIRSELIRRFAAAGIHTHSYRHAWQPVAPSGPSVQETSST